MRQIGIPIEVRPEEVARKRSFGQAIILCCELGGMEPKEVAIELNADKAQVSRWQNDQEGITWSRLNSLMDLCGNDAPLLWALDQRGYDITSLRKKQSETERRAAEAEALVAQYQQELETLRKYVGALK